VSTGGCPFTFELQHCNNCNTISSFTFELQHCNTATLQRYEKLVFTLKHDASGSAGFASRLPVAQRQLS
jgi:hypothetical protein